MIVAGLIATSYLTCLLLLYVPHQDPLGAYGRDRGHGHNDHRDILRVQLFDKPELLVVIRHADIITHA
jgi:hypothetical protein